MRIRWLLPRYATLPGSLQIAGEQQAVLALLLLECTSDMDAVAAEMKESLIDEYLHCNAYDPLFLSSDVSTVSLSRLSSHL